MPLTFHTHVVPDPDGHHSALLLRGDWLFIGLSDGAHTGWGEASHSGNDDRCLATAAELFEQHVRDLPPEPGALAELAAGPFAAAPDFVAATAISALDQGMQELIARRRGVPVWRLFGDQPVRGSVPLYVTINRALQARDRDDYDHIVGLVHDQGYHGFKCAPFEAVTPGPIQPLQACIGLDLLEHLAETFPDLSMRVDLHERFGPDAFAEIQPRLELIGPAWIEAPCPIGPDYARLRDRLNCPLAAGELFFGVGGFGPMINGRWCDVIMPDVKHVGGFGQLLEVCRLADAAGVEVSPHNPSGPIATLASVHAAAVAPNVTVLEYPFAVEPPWPVLQRCIRDGELHLPDGPGWGLPLEELI
jgi:galactonate dehydratase